MKYLSLFVISLLISPIINAQTWNKYYFSDSMAFFPVIFEVEPTHDNNLFLVGNDIFSGTKIFKVDRFSGDTIWTKMDSTVNSLKQIPGTQDYYITRAGGVFSQENWLSRIDGQLNTQWKLDFQLNAESIIDVDVLNDSSAFCFGFYSPMGGQGIFFKRVDKNGNIVLFDSTIQILPVDGLSLKFEKMPNDDIVFLAQDNSVFKFFRFNSMGVFRDSAIFAMPGRPELEFVYGINKYDHSINVMGIYEIDTTNLDTLDFASYYVSLDSNFAVRYQSNDTSTFNYLDLDFFSAENSARITTGIDTTQPFSLSFFDMTNKYLDFSLGNTPSNFPNFPFLVKYVGQSQVIVSGLGDAQFWAASFPTFINNLDAEINQKITVYPNPSNGIVNFRLDNISLKTEMDFKIFNLTGRMIYSDKTNSNYYSFNATKLEPGMYFYNIDTESKSFRGKFIIE